jgi:hypothetical protein
VQRKNEEAGETERNAMHARVRFEYRHTNLSNII